MVVLIVALLVAISSIICCALIVATGGFGVIVGVGGIVGVGVGTGGGMVGIIVDVFSPEEFAKKSTEERPIVAKITKRKIFPMCATL